jgi:putative transposase
MTEDTMAVVELAEKYAEGDLLRELCQLALQRLTEAEARCSAGLHEQSAELVNQRNGYCERELETRLETLELKIPKLRSGS